MGDLTQRGGASRSELLTLDQSLQLLCGFNSPARFIQDLPVGADAEPSRRQQPQGRWWRPDEPGVSFQELKAKLLASAA